jgi:replicative DNA helicase
LSAGHQADIPIDLLTIQDELKSRGKLEEVGGTEYLMAMLSQVPSAARVKHYADIVHEKYVLRSVLSMAVELQGIAYDPESDAEVAVNKVIDLALNLQSGKRSKGARPMSEIVMDAMVEIGNRIDMGGYEPPFKFGLHYLDHLTLGPPIGLTIIGARASEGKTSMLFDIINASMNSGPFLVISLDTSSKSLASRFISSRSGIPLNRLRRGVVFDDEPQAANEVANDLYTMPCYIYEDDLTIAEFRGVVKTELLHHGIKAVFIDYAQQIEGPGDGVPVQQMKVAQGLRRVALSMQIPIIAAVQLNRDTDKRRTTKNEEPFPRSSDIAWSDQYHREADLEILIHNPQPKEDEDGSHPRKVRLGIAKQKDGPTGVVHCWWNPKQLSFSDEDSRYSDDPEETQQAYWQD